MPRPPKKRPTTAKLRSWRVSIIRERAQPQHLGVVEAPDRQSAEIIAVEQFKLSDEQRRRLVISERRRED
jgi:hypothetical protein